MRCDTLFVCTAQRTENNHWSVAQASLPVQNSQEAKTKNSGALRRYTDKSELWISELAEGACATEEKNAGRKAGAPGRKEEMRMWTSAHPGRTRKETDVRTNFQSPRRG